jgi:hypothetical protein
MVNGVKMNVGGVDAATFEQRLALLREVGVRMGDPETQQRFRDQIRAITAAALRPGSVSVRSR